MSAETGKVPSSELASCVDAMEAAVGGVGSGAFGIRVELEKETFCGGCSQVCTRVMSSINK